MATYTSPAVANKTGVASSTQAGMVLCAQQTVTCTAAPSTSDTLEFFYLPAGASVLLAVLESSDMDTNGSPTLTLNVGDSGDADRLFAASTVGQTGALSTAIATTGANYTYSSKTLITGVANANAATGAAGTLTLTVFYTVA
jgi:hypothetical protein